MKDFNYIINIAAIGHIMEIDRKIWPFIYGYIMRHQYCYLYEFSPNDIIQILNRQIENNEWIEYDEINKSFICHNIDKNGIKEISKILHLLCFNMLIEKNTDNILIFKTNSIFDDEEIKFNGKRFTSTC